MTHVLLVEPDRTTATELARVLQPTAEVTVCSDFEGARGHLLEQPPEVLVTALRLREYNGLHLVYLAAALGLPTRSIVYTDADEAGLARDIQAAGAFYEVRHWLIVALPAYVTAMLPPYDRRAVIRRDRRRAVRGGRRVTDLTLAW